MTLTTDQQRRMRHVNPDKIEVDDYEYVMGDIMASGEWRYAFNNDSDAERFRRLCFGHRRYGTRTGNEVCIAAPLGLVGGWWQDVMYREGRGSFAAHPPIEYKQTRS